MLGLPIASALTGGEVSDCKGYLPIMEADGPAAQVLLADKRHRLNPPTGTIAILDALKR